MIWCAQDSRKSNITNKPHHIHTPGPEGSVQRMSKSPPWNCVVWCWCKYISNLFVQKWFQGFIALLYEGHKYEGVDQRWWLILASKFQKEKDWSRQGDIPLSCPLLQSSFSLLWTRRSGFFLLLSKNHIFFWPSLCLSWYHLITMASLSGKSIRILGRTYHNLGRMTRGFFRALPKDGQGEGFYVNSKVCHTRPYAASCPPNPAWDIKHGIREHEGREILDRQLPLLLLLPERGKGKRKSWSVNDLCSHYHQTRLHHYWEFLCYLNHHHIHTIVIISTDLFWEKYHSVCGSQTLHQTIGGLGCLWF